MIAWWNGRIVACFLLGAACGGLAFGWLGDKIGRVRAMIVSILTYSIFMGCGYFAKEPWHLAACLFISALGMGGQWSFGVALVMECWPERHRPKLAGVIGAASNVGFLMIAAGGLVFRRDPGVVAMAHAGGSKSRLAGPVHRDGGARVGTLERVEKKRRGQSAHRDIQTRTPA